MANQDTLQSERTVKLKVSRSSTGPGDQRSYQTFNVPYEPSMTILNALLYAKEKLDHSIAIRYSCRMASCGSCGMIINNLPRLACYTQVRDLPKGPITVEPLDHYP